MDYKRKRNHPVDTNDHHIPFVGKNVQYSADLLLKYVLNRFKRKLPDEQ